MSNQGYSAPQVDLPTFDGFPYLLTRLSPAFYHIILLPKELAPEALRSFARQQAQANQLPTCLVIDTSLCLYLSAETSEFVTGHVPRGGMLITGKLQFCEPLPESVELRERAALLERWLSGQRKQRFLIGDTRKGGRPASPQEAIQLEGKESDGVPNGLSRCLACGEWRGECLDPNPRFTGLVMRVHCRCENDSRCARCGNPFCDRKVDANYYEVADGVIWHVPGFSCLSHRCLP